jgi:hypothetical protein
VLWVVGAQQGCTSHVRPTGVPVAGCTSPGHPTAQLPSRTHGCSTGLWLGCQVRSDGCSGGWRGVPAQGTLRLSCQVGLMAVATGEVDPGRSSRNSVHEVLSCDGGRAKVYGMNLGFATAAATVLVADWQQSGL